MKRKLNSIYTRLSSAFGEQQWWPAETDFEVMVGAILTQNTAWTNVERAIANLKTEGELTADRMAAIEHAKLAQLIKPSGYFNIKAKRLQNFCRWYIAHGGYESLAKLDTETLRKGLLSVNGIGPETADDILLYAFERPIFVIDAYTKRLLLRLGLIQGDENYHQLQALFHRHTVADVNTYNQYHALIVQHAKANCRVKPQCEGCCLRRQCQYT